MYLSLNGTNYTNNSVIPITEIGHTDFYSMESNALQCTTDRRPCCLSLHRHGRWIFPDGVEVPIQAYATTFYQSRGDDGTVNLNRFNNLVLMPTGKFCCEAPDATDAVQTVCANIGNIAAWKTILS